MEMFLTILMPQLRFHKTLAVCKVVVFLTKRYLVDPMHIELMLEMTMG